MKNLSLISGIARDIRALCCFSACFNTCFVAGQLWIVVTCQARHKPFRTAPMASTSALSGAAAPWLVGARRQVRGGRGEWRVVGGAAGVTGRVLGESRKTFSRAGAATRRERASATRVRCVSTPDTERGDARPPRLPPTPEAIEVFATTEPGELRAAAAARSLSFYTYPADRSAFSIRAHRLMAGAYTRSLLSST